MTNIEQLPKQCKTCANKQFLNYDFRCVRYNQSLCERVHTFCQGKYYMNINDGISLFAFKAWLNNLSKDELELPLLFVDSKGILIPTMIVRTYKNNKDYWGFYAKREQEENNE